MSFHRQDWEALGAKAEEFIVEHWLPIVAALCLIFAAIFGYLLHA